MLSNVIFYGLNVFLVPENLGIDIKIIKFELIVTDLWPLESFGGHLGRHLEKILFWGSEFDDLCVYPLVFGTMNTFRLNI